MIFKNWIAKYEQIFDIYVTEGFCLDKQHFLFQNLKKLSTYQNLKKTVCFEFMDIYVTLPSNLYFKICEKTFSF